MSTRIGNLFFFSFSIRILFKSHEILIKIIWISSQPSVRHWQTPLFNNIVIHWMLSTFDSGLFTQRFSIENYTAFHPTEQFAFSEIRWNAATSTNCMKTPTLDGAQLNGTQKCVEFGRVPCADIRIYTLLSANAFKEKHESYTLRRRRPRRESVPGICRCRSLCSKSNDAVFWAMCEETIEKQLCFYCRRFGYRGSLQKSSIRCRCRCAPDMGNGNQVLCRAVSFAHVLTQAHCQLVCMHATAASLEMICSGNWYRCSISIEKNLHE